MNKLKLIFALVAIILTTNAAFSRAEDDDSQNQDKVKWSEVYANLWQVIIIIFHDWNWC